MTSILVPRFFHRSHLWDEEMKDPGNEVELPFGSSAPSFPVFEKGTPTILSILVFCCLVLAACDLRFSLSFYNFFPCCRDYESVVMFLKKEVHTLHVHGLFFLRVKKLKCGTGLLCSLSFDRFVINILYTQPFFVSSRNASSPQMCGEALRDDAKKGCVRDYHLYCVTCSSARHE